MRERRERQTDKLHFAKTSFFVVCHFWTRQVHWPEGQEGPTGLAKTGDVQNTESTRSRTVPDAVGYVVLLNKTNCNLFFGSTDFWYIAV